ncbi:uncharacterized protein BJ171DRAFT_497635 [Polychytrium aggregatum]|uniref:uncharacterized protein n=1 Tax=Polychytrium aggregatum TaxID=110093 RepID=UPI0022FF25DA|nr:uncharacterized protein BJ171DRAFT_497635 [Polychytrium aggregatum]KAI9206392.1 hypothetical protein BJ171DRAFT_497635 [Polychytrium aggregatum]
MSQSSSAHLDSSAKVFLVTGGNSGIGKGAVLEIARSPNHIVVIAARSMEKSKQVCQEIQAATGNSQVFAMKLELSSLDAVKVFAQEFRAQYRRLDGLICNAGIVPTKYEQSAQGYELTFATNHLGHFLLIQLLSDLLTSTASQLGQPTRLVIVSSFTINPKNISAMRFPNLEETLDPAILAEPPARFDEERAYTNSKLLNAITGYRLASTGILKNVLISVYDPGFVPTDLLRGYSKTRQVLLGVFVHKLLKYLWPRVSTIERSGGFMAKLVVESNESGKYYSVDREEEWAEKAKDPRLAKNVWDRSREMVAAWL